MDLLTIVLWVIGIGLALLIIKFLFLYLIRLLAGGLAVAFLPTLVCGILWYYDVIGQSAFETVFKWSFLIGIGLTFIYSLWHWREFFGQIAKDMDDEPSQSQKNYDNPNLPNLEPSVSPYQGVRHHKCCGSCRFYSNGGCGNTSSKTYLSGVDLDRDGTDCSWHSWRY